MANADQDLWKLRDSGSLLLQLLYELGVFQMQRFLVFLRLEGKLMDFPELDILALELICLDFELVSQVLRSWAKAHAGSGSGRGHSWEDRRCVFGRLLHDNELCSTVKAPLNGCGLDYELSEDR